MDGWEEGPRREEKGEESQTHLTMLVHSLSSLLLGDLICLVQSCTGYALSLSCAFIC